MQQYRLFGGHFNIGKFIVLVLLLIQAPNVLAQCVTVEPEVFLQKAEGEKAESQPVLREWFKLDGESSISFTSILLDPLSAQEREKIRSAIERQDPKKRRKIGIGRAVPAPYYDVIESGLYKWVSLPEGGRIAVFSVKSPEAAALRVKVKIIYLPERAELRFYNPANPKEIYGPYLVDQIQNQMVDGSFWSPVIESDSIAIEIFLPKGLNCEDISIAIPQIQHLWEPVLNSCGEERLESIGESGYCNVDVACTSWGGSLAERSVAKMVFTEGGYSYHCTGTMLNDNDPTTQVPYFLTAHHCISTQAAASNLITYWNFQKSSCYGPNPSGVTQRSGGAELLSTGSATDYTLLRLYQNPPSGTTFAGWTITPVIYGSEVVGIHHPSGDLKKISFGTVREFRYCTDDSDTFTCYPDDGGGYIGIRWYSGVTEPGSSGSALFNNQGYVIGTLKGGSSSCQDQYLEDDYARFDRTYPFVERWLGETVPANICDVDNPSDCSTQADCQNAGGYWYNNVCNATQQFSPPFVEEMSVPAKQSVWNYKSVEHPVILTKPEDCQPFAVGDLSTGNLNLQVELPAFSSGVDVYLAIGFADALFLIDGSNMLHPASESSVLPKWKANVSKAVAELLYGDIPTASLPGGVYNFFVLVVPAEETNFNHYYLWYTSLPITSALM